MTPATLDYLLRLAMEERDKLAEYLVHRGESHSVEWGEAAAAVRELLEMRQRAGADNGAH